VLRGKRIIIHTVNFATMNPSRMSNYNLKGPHASRKARVVAFQEQQQKQTKNESLTVLRSGYRTIFEEAERRNPTPTKRRSQSPATKRLPAQTTTTTTPSKIRMEAYEIQQQLHNNRRNERTYRLAEEREPSPPDVARKLPTQRIVTNKPLSIFRPKVQHLYQDEFAFPEPLRRWESDTYQDPSSDEMYSTTRQDLPSIIRRSQSTPFTQEMHQAPIGNRASFPTRVEYPSTSQKERPLPQKSHQKQQYFEPPSDNYLDELHKILLSDLCNDNEDRVHAGLERLANGDFHSRSMTDAGAYLIVVVSMRKWYASARVQTQGCRVLQMESDSGGNNNTTNNTQAVNAGALETLLLAMNNFASEEEVQDNALHVMLVLTWNEPVLMARLVVLGALESVLLAMEIHSHSERIQCCGIRCIMNLARIRDDLAEQLFVCLGASNIIVNAMKEFSQFQEIQKWGCRLLDHASDYVICRNSLAKAGALRVLATAIELFETNDDIQNHGRNAMMQLCLAD
jgi:hypothetical protein